MAKKKREKAFSFMHEVLRDVNDRGVARILKEDTVAFDINNVAKYFWEMSDQELWDERDDFPEIAPLYPRSWFEFTVPKKARSGDTIIDLPSYYAGTKFGFLNVAFDLKTDADILHNVIATVKDWEPGIVRLLSRPSGVRWIVFSLVFANSPYFGKALRNQPIATLYYAIEEEEGQAASLGMGRFKGEPKPVYVLHFLTDNAFRAVATKMLGKDFLGLPRDMQHAVYEKINGETAQWLLSVHWVVLLALSFAHAVNTDVEPTDRVSIPRYRQGKVGGSKTYNILRIKALERLIQRISAEEGVGLSKALHSVRMHRKKYGPKYGKGKLYGKHQGKWWWSSFYRGDPSRGQVKKDYGIDLPQQHGRQQMPNRVPLQRSGREHPVIFPEWWEVFGFDLRNVPDLPIAYGKEGIFDYYCPECGTFIANEEPIEDYIASHAYMDNISGLSGNGWFARWICPNCGLEFLTHDGDL